MYPRIPIPDSVRRLCAAQAGVISREQALGLGLTRSVIARLLAQQTWLRLTPGGYYTAGQHPPWLALAWAGVLLGGDSAQLCGRAAGHLWGLCTEPKMVDILLPHQERGRERAPWRFRRTRIPPRPVGSPPRTPLPQTVLDLCTTDPGRTAQWVQSATFGGRTSVSAILKALAARSRQPHRELIAAVLSDHQQGVQSELERIYRRDVERAHKLPAGKRQQVRLGRPSDVDYLGFLLVELDGRDGHAAPDQRLRDMARDNALLVNGHPTLRFGWQDVTERPCQVARQVTAVLRLFGWPGTLETCPNCRRMPIVETCAA